MTPEERQLLADTATGLLRLVEAHSDAVAGVQAALLEVYRAHFTIDDHKAETIARLNIALALMERRNGNGTRFLSDFIRKLEPWTKKEQ